MYLFPQCRVYELCSKTSLLVHSFSTDVLQNVNTLSSEHTHLFFIFILFINPLTSRSLADLSGFLPFYETTFQKNTTLVPNTHTNKKLLAAMCCVQRGKRWQQGNWGTRIKHKQLLLQVQYLFFIILQKVILILYADSFIKQIFFVPTCSHRMDGTFCFFKNLKILGEDFQ